MGLWRSFVQPAIDKVWGFVGDAASWLLKPFMPPIPKVDVPADQGFAIQTNFDTNVNLPLINGVVQLGGNAINKDVSDDYVYYHGFYSLAISRDDFRVDVLKIRVAGRNGEEYEPFYDVDQGGMVAGHPFADLLDVQISNEAFGAFFGAGPIDLGCSSYDQATHKFKAMLAVYIRCKKDNAVWRGEPQFEFIVDGGDRSPAYLIRDYLFDTENGASELPSDWYLPSFDGIDLLCNEVIEKAWFTAPVKRYEYNGVIDTGKDVKDNLKAILGLIHGEFTTVDGKYALVIKTQGDGVVTFDRNTFVAGTKVVEEPPRNQDFINTCEVKFTDANLNWKTNSAIYVDQTLKADRDNGIEKKLVITLNGENNYDRAMAYAEVTVKEHRFAKMVTCKTHWGIKAAEYDIINLDVPLNGYVGKEFRVLKRDINHDQTIDWTLQEHEDSIWDIENGNVAPSAGTVTYPNPSGRIGPPTNVAITVIDGANFAVTFDYPNMSALASYYVAEFVNIDTGASYEFSRAISPILCEINIAGEYDVTLYAVSELGVVGEQVYTTFNTDGLVVDQVQLSQAEVLDMLEGEITTSKLAQELAEPIAKIPAIETSVEGFADDLIDEAQARANADGSLSSAITAEQQARIDGDGAISQSVTTLTATVNGNISAIQAEEEARVNAVSAETNARQTAVSQLQNADNALTAAINSEASTRASADGALSSRVDTVQAKSKTLGVTAFRNDFESDEFGDWSNKTGASVVETTDHFTGDQAGLFTYAGEALYGGNSGGSTSAPSISIPDVVALQFAGKRIKITVYAKQPSAGASSEFAVAYSTSEVGNSGWNYFTQTTSFKPYSFYYDVPVASSGGVDYLGIAGDTTASGLGVIIDNVAIEVIASESDLPTIAENTSAIQAESTARADAISAEATTRTTQIATAKSEAISSANSYTDGEVSDLDSSVTAAIQNEATTRANADSALSQSITTLQSTVGDNTAAIQNEATTRAEADSVLSAQISTVQSSLGSNIASVQTIAEASATKLSGIDNNATMTGNGSISVDPELNLPNPFSFSSGTTTEYMVSNGGEFGTPALVAVGGTRSATKYCFFKNPDGSHMAVPARAGQKFKAVMRYKLDDGQDGGQFGLNLLPKEQGGANAGVYPVFIKGSGLVDDNAWRTIEAIAEVPIDAVNTAYCQFYFYFATGFEVGTFTVDSVDFYKLPNDVLNADKTSENTSADTEKVSGTSASTVKDNAATALSNSNTLLAKQGVKLDVNGYVTGYTQNNDGKTGSFMVRQDQFGVIDPESSVDIDSMTAQQIADALPFFISSGKVYMKSAYIRDGDVTNAKIGNIIQSNNYSAGSLGWLINKAGNAEFNSITVRDPYIKGALQNIYVAEDFYTELQRSSGEILLSSIPVSGPTGDYHRILISFNFQFTYISKVSTEQFWYKIMEGNNIVQDWIAAFDARNNNLVWSAVTGFLKTGNVTESTTLRVYVKIINGSSSDTKYDLRFSSQVIGVI